MNFDRRITPARPDLAAAHLRGKVEAERFVEGRPARIVAPSTPLKREPRGDAPYETEALAGEAVSLYDDDEGWAWVQLAADGYVGWLSANALDFAAGEPTHRISALRTFAYPALSIKTEPLAALSLGASVAVQRVEGNFAATRHGWIYRDHLRPITEAEPDFVDIAGRFAGVPYLWGGKSSLGLDCSALVQLSMASAGLGAPRDSDMQQRDVGRALEEGEALRRGDLVFWKGHVGIMESESVLLHASGHHMMVVHEPLDMALARIERQGGGTPTAKKRLPALGTMPVRTNP